MLFWELLFKSKIKSPKVNVFVKFQKISKLLNINSELNEHHNLPFLHQRGISQIPWGTFGTLSCQQRRPPPSSRQKEPGISFLLTCGRHAFLHREMAEWKEKNSTSVLLYYVRELKGGDHVYWPNELDNLKRTEKKGLGCAQRASTFAKSNISLALCVHLCMHERHSWGCVSPGELRWLWSEWC